MIKEVQYQLQTSKLDLSLTFVMICFCTKIRSCLQFVSGDQCFWKCRCLNWDVYFMKGGQNLVDRLFLHLYSWLVEWYAGRSLGNVDWPLLALFFKKKFFLQRPYDPQMDGKVCVLVPLGEVVSECLTLVNLEESDLLLSAGWCPSTWISSKGSWCSWWQISLVCAQRYLDLFAETDC